MEYDAIIIGTGQAGPSLAVKLASNGLKTAIIEKGNFGGTCVNNGCTPTKTMVASARIAHLTRRAHEFGVNIEGSIAVDIKKVMERKDMLVKQSNTGVENWLRSTENITVYQGHARFTSSNTIEVNGRSLSAQRIFINTGTSPRIPSGFERADFLTNESIMEIDFIPEHLVIVGGSYIGLEFGQMFRRFGSEVTIIEKSDRLLSKEDSYVSGEILEMLENEGINVKLNATCLKGYNISSGVVLEIDCENESKQVLGSHLLFAAGRKPNTDSLGLTEAGIIMNEEGFIQVDEHLQTNREGIWALGDVNGRGGFTHTSYNDYEIVAANLFDNDARKISDRIPSYALYTDPPLARIGMNESQARGSGKNVLMAERPMSRIARAKEKSETRGFIKILVDADTELILGATIFGIEADEVIHSLLDIMYAKTSYKVIQRAVHIHPTISELIPTILGDLKPLK